MKLRRFLNVVPESVKIAAYIIAGCATLGGVLVGFFQASHGRICASAVRSLSTFAGVGFGLVGGISAGLVLAAWLMCVGYVYADAGRREMPPILWTLVVIFIPNLLGFLLYFAIRRPIEQRCAHCNRAITANHRFCSWCGSERPPTPSGQSAPPPPASGLDRMSAG